MAGRAQRAARAALRLGERARAVGLDANAARVARVERRERVAADGEAAGVDREARARAVSGDVRAFADERLGLGIEDIDAHRGADADFAGRQHADDLVDVARVV